MSIGNNGATFKDGDCVFITEKCVNESGSLLGFAECVGVVLPSSFGSIKPKH